MGTETIVFSYPTPVGVHHTRPLCRRADTIAPVVFIGKTAAGPAQAGDLYLFQRVHHSQADTVLLFNRQGFIYPKTTVNAMPQMLGKLAISVFADDAFGGIAEGNSGRFPGEAVEAQRNKNNEKQFFEYHGINVFRTVYKCRKNFISEIRKKR